MFLDTDVCIHLANSEARLRELEKLRKRQGWKLLSSPLALIELLNGIHTDRGRHFQESQRAIRVLVGRGRINFLRFPGEFVCKTLLDRACPATRLFSRQIENWAKFAIQSRDWKHFCSERKFGSSVRKMFSFKPEIVAEQLAEERSWYVETLSEFQVARQPLGKGPKSERVVSPEYWTKRMFLRLGLVITEDQAQECSKRLTAARLFDLAGLDLTRVQSYKAETRSHDSTDWQHLLYLCDPLINFVTDDTKIRTRCIGSPDASRIHILRELIKE